MPVETFLPHNYDDSHLIFRENVFALVSIFIALNKVKLFIVKNHNIYSIFD